MHNSVNRWLTAVLLTLFVAIIAYGARGAARARPGNAPPSNVIVLNGPGNPVATSIQGTPNVNVSSLPAVQVSNLPAVQDVNVNSLPAVQVSSLPAVQLAPGTAVSVSSLPAVQIAGGQSIATTSYGDTHPFQISGSIASMNDCEMSADSGVLFTIPAGNTLIIDSIDLDANSDNGGNYAAVVNVYTSSSSAHVVPKQLEGFSNRAVANQPTHLSVGPGATINVSAQRADGRQSGRAVNFITISGHYVPAP